MTEGMDRDNNSHPYAIKMPHTTQNGGLAPEQQQCVEIIHDAYAKLEILQQQEASDEQYWVEMVEKRKKELGEKEMGVVLPTEGEGERGLEEGGGEERRVQFSEEGKEGKEHFGGGSRPTTPGVDELKEEMMKHQKEREAAAEEQMGRARAAAERLV